MSELLLQPFFTWDTAELADELYDLVGGNEQSLRDRNYLDVITRYFRSRSTARASVEAAKEEHMGQEVGHYAIVNKLGNLAGAATISRYSHPLRQRNYLWPVKLPYAAPQLRAWTHFSDKTNDHELDLLTPAFAELLHRSQLPSWREPSQVPWTVEPPRQPYNKAYHEAIIDAGFTEVRTAHYATNGKATAPPALTLYAAFPGDFSHYSAKAKEHRLRKLT